MLILLWFSWLLILVTLISIYGVLTVSGCCYNTSNYQLGSAVVELPECCTDLVCGARLTDTEPFFTTSIVQIIYEPPPG